MVDIEPLNEERAVVIVGDEEMGRGRPKVGESFPPSKAVPKSMRA